MQHLIYIKNKIGRIIFSTALCSYLALDLLLLYANQYNVLSVFFAPTLEG